jgi:hypothetical protein
MFSPVLAAPNEPVLGASTDRAVLYLFLTFFHTCHITAHVLFEVDAPRRWGTSMFYESAKKKK